MTPPVQSTNPLAELAPNILPDPIGFWPPAPGWWLLAALTLTMVVVTAGAARRFYQRRAYRRQALKQLAVIQQAFAQHQNQQQLIRELNYLLKSTALSAFPRDQIAALHGQQWLSFLDRHLNKEQLFTTRAGQALGDDRYNPSVQISADDLLHITGLWIRRHHV